MLVGIYQLFLLKMIRKAVVRHWIEEIESGRINLPQVLESYTEELLGQVDALFFGYVDAETKKSIAGGFKNFTRAQLVKLRKRWAVRRRDSAPTS